VVVVIDGWEKVRSSGGVATYRDLGVDLSWVDQATRHEGKAQRSLPNKRVNQARKSAGKQTMTLDCNKAACLVRNWGAKEAASNQRWTGSLALL